MYMSIACGQLDYDQGADPSGQVKGLPDLHNSGPDGQEGGDPGCAVAVWPPSQVNCHGTAVSSSHCGLPLLHGLIGLGGGGAMSPPPWQVQRGLPFLRSHGGNFDVSRGDPSPHKQLGVLPSVHSGRGNIASAQRACTHKTTSITTPNLSMCIIIFCVEK